MIVPNISAVPASLVSMVRPREIEVRRGEASQQIKDDEPRAREWLQEQGYSDIQKPPDDPPDFVVDGRIAVEVTRLNQRISVHGDEKSIGDEQVRMPLTDSMEAVVCQLGSPGNKGRSWAIDCEYDFSKPLPKKKAKVINRQVSAALAPLLGPYDNSVIRAMQTENRDCHWHAGVPVDTSPLCLCLACGICLELYEISSELENFTLNNVADRQGMMLAKALEESMQYSVGEKTDRYKKTNLDRKYRHLWLVLVDRILGYHCHASIPHLLKDELFRISAIKDGKTCGFWDRIVVISSSGGPIKHLEIDPVSGRFR